MNKFLMRRIGFSLIAVLMTVLITFTHAVAQELPFYWDYINVNIDVQSNGDMLITETQKYVFKSDYSTQRYRYIRLDKFDEIKDVTVEENNQIIPSETGIENNQFWIRWQHQLKPLETHIFVLKYRVVGGLQINNDNTQVYWKAIFADRKAPVQAANVQVQLPEALSGKVLEFKNFGTAATARQVNPKTFEFVATQPIQPQENLEIQITFPSNILNITKPNWQQGNFWNIISFLFRIIMMILLAPLAIVIGLFILMVVVQIVFFIIQYIAMVIVMAIMIISSIIGK
ncbi:DUF2207 domain-containing protein [Anabaena lutea]|uniref:DUF2207 domain-containing protein n=1 Tax=Anabaena lutea FACHB-196 TaxID=2692881 RepID=A0ABR8FAY1_9NOST|nr:DUF2207 domain-containing protein [Anabaena lutea]MBD2566751.1 DUF2207 domain-containing protein [Anabaena lutea FACHB-196]